MSGTEHRNAAAASQAWSAVWGTSVTSITGSEPAHLQIAQWWADALRSLGYPTRVLEIGAGASAQPARLAARLFPKALVVASDFRDAAASALLKFVGNAPIEALPFADAEFDLVVSQFAFEYAEPARAVAELSRVTRPQGAALLLMHHPDSVLARDVAHRMRCLSAGAALHDLLAGHLTPEDRQRQLRPLLRRIEEQIAFHQRPPARQYVLRDLHDFARIAGGALANPAAATAAEDLHLLAQCAPAILLAQEQKRASLSTARLTQLMENFRSAGFAAAGFQRLEFAGKPLAWAVRLQK